MSARERSKTNLASYAQHIDFCEICGSNGDTALHHIVFRSQLGSDDWWNIASLCPKCHDMAHGVCAKVIREGLLARKISDGYEVPIKVQLEVFGGSFWYSPREGDHEHPIAVSVWGRRKLWLVEHTQLDEIKETLDIPERAAVVWTDLREQVDKKPTPYWIV